MGKTFKDIDKNKHVLPDDKNDFELSVDYDIVSEEISSYVITICEKQIEIDEETYLAIEKYRKTLR